MLRDAFGLEAGGVDLPTFPPFALFDPALGVTSIIPDMDPTRPAKADPRRLLQAIERFGVTQLFGSPALVGVLARHGAHLPTVKRVLSAGAPVPADVVARMRELLPDDAQLWTPYGATECLPVSVIEGRELQATREATERGAGTCVGRPVPPNEVRIIRIDDDAIDQWSDALLVQPGQIGEITVAGPTATDTYFRRDAATKLAKIRETTASGERIVHRMGDLGWIDGEGRLWFCGRKTQRVVDRRHDDALHRAGRADLQHASGRAAHGAGRRRHEAARKRPVLCVEIARGVGATLPTVARELRHIARRPRAHREDPPLPAPPRLPRRHPPQRQDRPREARALGREGHGAARMKVLVTGGGGFLGQALCRNLVERGFEVVSFNRGRYPALDALGVRQMQGDLADRDAMVNAAQGVGAIFHNAAKAGAWGPYDDYFRANVLGTRNVLDACRTHGIARLVYTSTPSVTHRATHPVEGGTADTVPYGSGFKAAYATTKTIAEQEVLAANDANLATVALRPRLIWGPGDNQLVPRLADRARAGRLRIVGSGENLIDTTYIDNAAQAHIDAFHHLVPGAACAGRAYFISNGEPMEARQAGECVAARGGRARGGKTPVVPHGLRDRRGVRDGLVDAAACAASRR